MPPNARTPLLAAAALALLGAAGAQIPSDFELTGSHVGLRFATDANDPVPGTSVELLEMQRLQPPPVPGPLVMASGAGGWTIRFVLDHDEYTGAGTCNGLGGPGDPLEWFEVSMDGSVARWNPADPDPLGDLDALTLDSVVLTPGAFGASGVEVRWTVSVTLEGASASYRVTAEWDVLAGRALAETRLRVRRTTPGAPGFYVSQVVYPEVYVADMQSPSTPDDALVVPWVAGSVVTNPADPSKPFPSFLADGLNFFPVNLAAYTDGVDGGNTFMVYADDGESHWKDLWLNAAGPVGARYVSFRMRHVPEDAFAADAWAMPYAVRLGALTGDWWDVADHYRGFLEAEMPWYAGPVGSPANPMPQHGKDLVGEVYMITGYRGDRMDLLARQNLDVKRVMGTDVNTVWYGAYHPDEFEKFFYNGGYLPGVPSFVGAVREGQKAGLVVSPYVNGSSGADYLDPLIPDPPPPTQLHLDVHDAFMLDEDLEEEYFCYGKSGPPRHALLCAGAPWWRHAFVDQLVEIATFTGCAGVYLDFWMTSACWSDEHLPDGAGAGHAPGGGDWMVLQRLAQLAEVKAAVPQELLVSQEFLHGRWSEEIHLQHHDTVLPPLSAETHPGTTVPKPMENARLVPLFRAIFDNVKLSRIATQVPDLAGRRSWVEANNALTFGMIPEVTQQLVEWIPTLGQRFAYGAFYDFFASWSGSTSGQLPFGAGTVPPGGGAGSSGDTSLVDSIVPQKHAFNSPYYRFLETLTRSLRDHGLRTWHNGTIRRLPDHVVTPVQGFTGVPGVETTLGDLQESTPTYVEDFLTPGMFQAPADLDTPDAGSLCFVVANPWVDPSQQATFPLEFTFEPSLYPGWTDGTTYGVTRYDDDGLVLPVNGGTQGPLTLTRSVPPGEITWWVFRDTTVVVPTDP